VKRLVYILFCGAALAQSPPYTGVLDPSRAPSTTGWNPGAPLINETRTQCVTSACNTVSGGTVTAASVNAALNSAPAHTYVLMPSGTFTPSAAIVAQASNPYVTLRGAGANSTFLLFSGHASSYAFCGGNDLCASSQDTNYQFTQSNTANISGSPAKGATSVTLTGASGSNPAIGQPIIYDQIDDQSDTGSVYAGCERGGTYGSNGDSSSACYYAAGPNGYERPNGSSSTLATIRGQQQIATVTGVVGTCSSSCTVTFTPGIYAPNWSSAKSPGAWWPSTPQYGVGFEDFSFTVDSSAGAGISLFNCSGCWVKGVRGINPNTSGSSWAFVACNVCNQATIRDSYFWGNLGVDQYGPAVFIGSDVLIENNIVQYPTVYQFPNSDCEGCVSDYNYGPGEASFGGGTDLGPASELHGLTFFTLYEGNIGAGIYDDQFHGSHNFNVSFRNLMPGRWQNNGSATSTDTVPIRMLPADRYGSHIGNILGTPGYHTSYKYGVANNSSNLNALSTGYATSIILTGAYPDVQGGTAAVVNTSNSSTGGCTAPSGGGCVTYQSGVNFTSSSGCSACGGPPIAGNLVLIGSTLYTVGAVVSATVLSVTSPHPGTQTNANFTVAPFDSLVNSTAMFWGNWDAVSAAARWCGNSSNTGWTTTCGSISEVPSGLSQYANPIPSTQTLPASFLYSSKPSWWPSGFAWPPIGPDVTGGTVGQCSGGTYDSSEATSSAQCTGGTQSAIGGGLANVTPAMNCYLNVMGGTPNGTGGALSFSRTTCYPATPAVPATISFLPSKKGFL
jgi:hypothetical protein